ncbi:hypothetical protein ACQP3L_34280, partial [Escherichia coli]
IFYTPTAIVQHGVTGLHLQLGAQDVMGFCFFLGAFRNLQGELVLYLDTTSLSNSYFYHFKEKGVVNIAGKLVPRLDFY